MEKLFYVIFEDGSKYDGGEEFKNSGWKEIPDKKIRSLVYRLPHGDHIILSGYDKYYQAIEEVYDLNGNEAGIRKVEYVYLMGKKDKKVLIYKISFRKNDFGFISTSVLEDNDRFITGLLLEGWK